MGLIIILIGLPMLAQHTYTLEQAIELAKIQSPHFYKAQNTFERSHWSFKNYLASFKPHVRLHATLPSYSRSITPVTQQDGSIAFRAISQSNNSLGLNIVQHIALTGGKLTLGSQLQRNVNFIDNGKSNYLSTPFSIKYNQESLLFNKFKWQKQLEPLRYSIAQREYTEAIEDAGLQVVHVFFEALLQQEAFKIAQASKLNSDTLYNIVRQRFELGVVGENEVLQLELGVLNAQNQVNQTAINWELNKQKFKRFLTLSNAEDILLTSPQNFIDVNIPLEKALLEANQNRKAVLEFREKRIAVEQEIARAKGQNSLEFGINANLGTQKNALSFGEAYTDFQSQQYVGVNVDFPILDWGYRKSQIKLAKANKDLTDVIIKQDEVNLEQEIVLQVMRYQQQKTQIYAAHRAQEVAQKRLEIAKQRYLLGKISTTDINIAFNENQHANQNYLRNLSDFWTAFYTLRRLTLYDFQANQKIQYSNQLDEKQ
ncbi:MAG: TolC family protein [Pseudarcicella sp.]|nr:TolC family protein [Pseudarcicella sp.]